MNYSVGTLGVNYGMKIFINTSSNPLDRTIEPIWSELGDGINNISEALNENVISSYYLINHGWGNTEVTAMNPSFTLTGVRMHGDPAQDWIFKRKFKMLDSRKTQMKVQCFNPDNADVMYDYYMCDITISNLQEYSGATEAGSDISMTVNFNGSPTQVVLPVKFNIEGNDTTSVKVSMSCATEGATIYYTTDGTEPTSSSTIYSGTITETSNTDVTKTYKAIAVLNGYQDSEVTQVSISVKGNT